MASAKELAQRAGRSADTRELSPDELLHLQQVLLDCFSDVQAMCERHHLRIMLGGGSCLGAVRHRGFIPWDDDLDALMPREDFEIFKEKFNEELGDAYTLDAPNFSDAPSNRFAKVLINGTKFVEMGGDPADPLCKIKIDIFVIENVPAGKFSRTLKGLSCQALMLIASAVQTFETDRKNGRKPASDDEEWLRFYRRRVRIGRLFSARSSRCWLDRVDAACQYKKAGDLLGIPTGRGHYFGEILPTKAFLPPVRGEFAGRTVYLPCDANAYLSNLYGDYMVIPPPEKREKHYITAIDFGEK